VPGAVEVPSKPVVVLPVLQTGARAVLWDDPNPWRDAWADAAGRSQLAMMVPVGDLNDVSAIDAPLATSGDATALKAISARYQNDDIVVAKGSLNADPRRFDITASRYAMSNLAAPQTLIVSTSAKPVKRTGN